MGAGQSSGRAHRQQQSPQDNAQQDNAQLRARIQLLEELCAHGEPGRRAQALQQLATGQADRETLDVANVLASRPPEFQPGQLIAAGSYGRVYAGTYGDQPAALKLLLLDEETAHAILNEVRLCLKLNHKNLVQLLDCAVVATNKQAAAAWFAVPSTPGSAFTGQHQILPVFGGAATSSPVTPCPAAALSYLPVVSSQVSFSTPQAQAAPAGHPAASSGGSSNNSSSGSTALASAAAHKDAGMPSTAEMAQHDSGRLPGLSSSLGHACFEVWIAMELCDGGTLAEQLQQGFHCFPGSSVVDMEQLLQVGLDIAHALTYMHRESVCHGDLKTENVLLKTLSASAAADLQQQRTCSACGSTGTCCQEECWLTFFCNNSSAGSTTVCSRYCRSCSGDSCWSCYTRGTEGAGGSSSPDSASSCSSSCASGPNAERRGRVGFRSGHILSGLCCMGSPSSCATEDDVWEQHERAAASGCFLCGGCGVMTLEPSEPSPYSRAPAPPAEPQPLPQLERLSQPAAEAALQPGGADGPAGGSASQPVPLFMLPAHTAAAGASFEPMLAPAGACHVFGVPPPIVEGVEQVAELQVPLLAAGGLLGAAEQVPGVPAALEDAPEEEHVAPLSLYAQARQRRRSRCLPPGVVLPTALAAAAAAAAALHGGGTEALHGSAASSNGGAGSSSGSASGSEDEGVAGQAGPPKGPGGRSSPPMQQGRSMQRQASLDESILLAGLRDTAAGFAGYGSISKLHPADAAAGVPSSWQEGTSSSAGAAAGAAAAAVCHDVYAHSMMRPPVARRARRHSYCCGTASSYFAPAAGFSRTGGQPALSGGVSATTAAAAIAAAAEAARNDSMRGPAAASSSSRRNRRMSWDDRILQQQSPAYSVLSGLLGAALPAEPPHPGADAPAAQPAGRRSRRHSWAGYLQPDMSAAAGALGWSMRPGTSVSDKQQQREQAPAGHPPFTRRQSSFDSYYGALASAAAGSQGSLGPIPASSRTGRKARRHSWAGYGLDQGLGRRPGLRALSSCFAAADGSSSPPLGQSSLPASPPRLLFSLPSLPSCCGDSSCLDDACVEADCSRHALLEGVQLSTSVLLDRSTPECLSLDAEAGAAPSVGCFGRWCSSGSSLLSSAGSAGQPRGRRRYSWCCGAGSEAELWADLNRAESYSQVGLLSQTGPLSLPLQPQQRRPRRSRRSSWDGFRYRGKPSGAWPHKAASLDAQQSSPGSWRSQPLSSDSCEPLAQQPGLRPPAVDTQSEGLPQVPPWGELSDASAGLFASPPQPAPGTTPLASLTSCSSTPAAGPSAGPPVVRLISCGSSPAAGLAATPRPKTAGSCSNSPGVDEPTPTTPIMHSAPGSPPPADTRPDMHADQGSSVPNVSLGWAVAASKTSRVRVSLDQPLSLSPTFKQQQVHAAPGADAGLAVARTAPDCGAAGSSRDAASASGVAARSGLQQPGGGSAAGPSAGAATVRQVTVQDLLSLCEPTRNPACATAPPATAAVAAGVVGVSGAGAAAVPAAQQLFTGSFSLRPAAGSMVLDAGAAEQRRERRWSTGVAAHQLLIRKQLLDVHGSDVLNSIGVPAAASAASCSTQYVTAGTSGNGGVQGAVELLQGPSQRSAWAVPPPSLGAGALEPAPAALREAGASSCGSSSRQGSVVSGSALVSSSNVSAAINVLGMPRQPSAIMSQRRLSYDTATGVYQLVAQMDSTHPLAGYAQVGDGDSLWQQQQQQRISRVARPPLAPLQIPAVVQPVEVLDLLPDPPADRAAACVQQQSAAGTTRSSSGGAHTPMHTATQLQEDEQMQQHCQAQMQRLLDALARKGCGWLDASDPAGTSSSSMQASQSATAQPMPVAAAASAAPSGPVATLQHQQQVAHEVARVTQRTFCAKVCDFGFSKCLRAGQSHCSTASAGTITHQAPEVLRSSHLSPAADVYAFGIILWELLTRDRPFKGLLEGDLVVGVCDRGLRPIFPPGCPASYVTLAQQCWSDDPAQRPTAAQLVQRLNELLYEERRARLRATVGATVPRHAQECRRRRHSMPVAGYNSRQRRRSRRMSLFLLPFARQPVVPEDAPLEQQPDNWAPLSGTHAAVHHGSAATATPSQSCTCTQQQPVANSSPVRARRSAFGLSFGASSADSSGCHASRGSGGGSGAGNALALSGGLLSGAGAASRLKAGASASALAAAGSSVTAGVAHSAPAAAHIAGDGTEWFESF